MRELIVYSRPGCHLCEEAIEIVEPLCRATGVALSIRNVDDETEWRERYGTRIPVFCSPLEELSGWPPDLSRIRQWLDAVVGTDR
jgi:hypothetical protein